MESESNKIIREWEIEKKLDKEVEYIKAHLKTDDDPLLKTALENLFKKKRMDETSILIFFLLKNIASINDEIKKIRDELKRFQV